MSDDIDALIHAGAWRGSPGDDRSTADPGWQRFEPIYGEVEAFRSGQLGSFRHAMVGIRIDGVKADGYAGQVVAQLDVGVRDEHGLAAPFFFIIRALDE